MRNLTVGLAIIIGISLLGFSSCGEPAVPAELMISDYPKLFEKEAIIVVGANATPLEQEGAMLIAEKLAELTGTKPLVKTDAQILPEDKPNYNLIIVGTPQSNRTLQEIYQLTKVTKVTGGYPGEGKGLVEIVPNPWNDDKALLIAAGSSDWGVKAASTLLTQEEMVEELNGKIMVTSSLISLIGQIKIVGSEPFSQAAIETENGLYGLTGSKAAKGGELWNLQQAMVEIEGFVEGRHSPSYRTEISIRVTEFRKI